MLRIFDKYDNAGRNGYTLAEMLLVLVIVGLVMAALPRATKKLFHVTTKSGDNGRLECFWDDSGEGAPVLTKYYATSGGTTMTCRDKEGEECAATHFANVPNPDGGADLRACVFQPPKNPVYLSLHAVGGGGSGAWPMIDRDGSGTYYTTPTSEVYSQDLIDGSSRDLSTVEEWWKTLRNDANKGSHPTFNNVAPYTDDEKRGHDWDALKQMFNEYTYSTDDGTFTRDGEDEAKNKKYNVYTKTIWNRYLLRYANAGKAGQVVSMYFPQVPGNSRLLVVPGRGGSVSESLNSSSDGNDFNGVAGTDTVVFMDNNSSGTPEVLMRASGGSSGISAKLGSNGDIQEIYDNYNSTNSWGGDASDYFSYGTSDNVKAKDSGFVDAIAGGSTNIDSKILELEQARKNKMNSENKAIPSFGDSGWGSYNVLSNTSSNHLFFVDDYDTWKKIGSGSLRTLGHRWTNVTPYIQMPNGAAANGCEYKRGSYQDSNDLQGYRVGTEFTGDCITYDSNKYCAIGSLTKYDFNNATTSNANPIGIRWGFNTTETTRDMRKEVPAEPCKFSDSTEGGKWNCFDLSRDQCNSYVKSQKCDLAQLKYTVSQLQCINTTSSSCYETWNYNNWSDLDSKYYYDIALTHYDACNGSNHPEVKIKILADGNKYDWHYKCNGYTNNEDFQSYYQRYTGQTGNVHAKLACITKTNNKNYIKPSEIYSLILDRISALNNRYTCDTEHANEPYCKCNTKQEGEQINVPSGYIYQQDDYAVFKFSGSNYSTVTKNPSNDDNRYYKYTDATAADTYGLSGASGCYFKPATTTSNEMMICSLLPQKYSAQTEHEYVDYISCKQKADAKKTVDCKQGGSTTNLCKPTRGGNGAAVLIW